METFLIKNLDSIKNLSDSDIRLLLLVILLMQRNMLPIEFSTQESQVEHYLEYIRNGLKTKEKLPEQ